MYQSTYFKSLYYLYEYVVQCTALVGYVVCVAPHGSLCSVLV